MHVELNNAETTITKTVKKGLNSGRIYVQKKYIGRKVLVVILEEKLEQKIND